MVAVVASIAQEHGFFNITAAARVANVLLQRVGIILNQLVFTTSANRILVIWVEMAISSSFLI